MKNRSSLLMVEPGEGKMETFAQFFLAESGLRYIESDGEGRAENTEVEEVVGPFKTIHIWKTPFFVLLQACPPNVRMSYFLTSHIRSITGEMRTMEV